MSLFRRSTRAIVTGRRSATTEPTLGAATSLGDGVMPPEGAPAPKSYFEEKVIMTIKNLPQWALWAIGGVAVLVVLCIVLVVCAPEKQPEIPEKQSVAAIEVNPVLAAGISAGDLISLFDDEGNLIPALQ